MMNTYRWTVLLSVMLSVLFVVFATSLGLVLQDVMKPHKPSYTSSDQRTWQQITRSASANDGIVSDAVPTTQVYHDFFETTCKLRSAAFYNIQNNKCYSLLYTATVPFWPLASGAETSRQGYYGVSCDSPDGNCCNGVIRSQSDAAGGATLPCWVSKDPSFQFVYFGLPPYAPFPSTPLAIAMLVVCPLALAAFVAIIIVIACCTRAEEIRRQFAFYGRIMMKKCLCCGDDAPPRMRLIAFHEPVDGVNNNNNTQQHAMVTIHGNQMSILDTTYAAKVADSLSDPSFREAMKEACVVCLEPLGEGGDSVALLPCGHMFHAACINDVFNMRLNAAETPCCVCQRNTRLVDITLVSVPPLDATTSSDDAGATEENDSFPGATTVEVTPVDEPGLPS
ncbi:zinc finger protein, putative [Bodo saltans]|uniref:Zinc finger protein, putative n=1 Tax=Bodo saltans TaxID=75058 RepID=A0A0S4JIA3_BODSA|nr:zinc finger protein, putative [Bodo saltans]|eukprot:CUG89904.1 zinc finger protein, putative [Bodo saltans]